MIDNAPELAVLERHGIDPDDAVGVLREFISIPSGTGHEAAMAARCAEIAGERGLTARLQQIAVDRFNALATVESRSSGPSLLFNGHMDTSSTGTEKHLTGLGYKAAPVMRDGWLLGLGALNMKSGLAAALVAAAGMARSGAVARGSITVAGVSGEIEKACVDEFQGPEYAGYGFGTRQLLAHGTTADFGVVCEPSGFEITNGQFGAVWVKITVPGESKHTAFATADTDHAVYKAAKLVAGLERWGAGYGERNAYEGQPAPVNVSAVRGGWPWRLSRTPADCHLYVDLRLHPRQKPQEALTELSEVTAELIGPRFAAVPYVIVPGFVEDPSGPLYDAFRGAHRDVIGGEAPLAFCGPMTDAVHLVRAGIPTVIYGLGHSVSDFDRVHPETNEAGEHVRIVDYLKLIAVYLGVMHGLCG